MGRWCNPNTRLEKTTYTPICSLSTRGEPYTPTCSQSIRGEPYTPTGSPSTGGEIYIPTNSLSTTHSLTHPPNPFTHSLTHTHTNSFLHYKCPFSSPNPHSSTHQQESTLHSPPLPQLLTDPPPLSLTHTLSPATHSPGSTGGESASNTRLSSSCRKTERNTAALEQWWVWPCRQTQCWYNKRGLKWRTNKCFRICLSVAMDATPYPTPHPQPTHPSPPLCRQP